MTILDENEEDHPQRLINLIEIGIDEVGRGSVFGPVFSAAIVLSKKNSLILKELGVNDSKKLSSKKRRIRNVERCWGRSTNEIINLKLTH